MAGVQVGDGEGCAAGAFHQHAVGVGEFDQGGDCVGIGYREAGNRVGEGAFEGLPATLLAPSEVAIEVMEGRVTRSPAARMPLYFRNS